LHASPEIELKFDLARCRVGASGRIRLDPDAGLDAAFPAIAGACIRQFRLGEMRMMETGDAAAVHQARVGLRRLRTAFWLFRPLFRPLFRGDAQAQHLREELRWLAGTLGHLRNLDVLAGRLEGANRDRVLAARPAELARARQELASPRARALMIDLVAWLASGPWKESLERNGRDLQHHAADVLARQRSRIKRGGRHLARLDDRERHKLRIAAKKLRYATQFFAGLFPGKRARRRRKAFARHLARLQDHLGTLNDNAIMPGVMASLGFDRPAPADPARQRALLAKAEVAVAAMVKVRPFWR
jgi:CHAD domain-containing protein